VPESTTLEEELDLSKDRVGCWACTTVQTL
jgi:hypothetical protein